MSVGGWLQWLDGTYDDLAHSVVADASGNVYVSGISSSSGDVVQFGGVTFAKPAAPTADYISFVGKLDSSGVPQWLRWLGGSSVYSDTRHSLAIDSDGNVYVSGVSDVNGVSVPFGETTVAKPATVAFATFVGKFDHSGAPLWLQWIDSDGSDQGYSIGADSAGNVYITGTCDSSGASIRMGDTFYSKPALPETGSMFIGKLNSSGIAQWVKWLIGGETVGYSVSADSLGDIYVSGFSRETADHIVFGDATVAKPSTSSSAAFIGKLNGAGELQWLKWLDGTSDEFGHSVVTADISGNVYITGTSVSTDTSVSLGGTQFAKPATSAGMPATYIGKLNMFGQVIWLKWLNGTYTEKGYSVIADPHGGVYVAGYSDTTGTSVQFGDETYTKPATTGQVAFVGKMNANGSPLWLQWLNGAGTYESARSVAVDFSGNVYVSGYSNTTDTSIQFGEVTYSKPATLGSAAFIGRLLPPTAYTRTPPNGILTKNTLSGTVMRRGQISRVRVPNVLPPPPTNVTITPTNPGSGGGGFGGGGGGLIL